MRLFFVWLLVICTLLGCNKHLYKYYKGYSQSKGSSLIDAGGTNDRKTNLRIIDLKKVYYDTLLLK